MLRYCILILFTAQISQADILTNLTRSDYYYSEVARIVGSTAVVAGDLPALNYLVYIAKKAVTGASPVPETQLGEGIVVNKYWIVTLKAVLDDTMNAKDIKLVFDSLDPMTTATTVRGGKEIKTEVTVCAANPLNCISVCRFCPKLDSHSATFETTLTPYTAGTNMNMYTYKDDTPFMRASSTRELHMATKKIGEPCECSDHAKYATAVHICLAENTAVYTGNSANNFDKKGIVVTNSDKTKVLGFIVKNQDNSATTTSPGEFVYVLKADSTNTWIADNTPES